MRRRRRHEPKTNPKIGELFREAVRNQLRDDTPPESRLTLARLMEQHGCSEAEAIEFMACVIACEYFDMVKQKQEYDEQRYLRRLRALPKLPWDE